MARPAVLITRRIFPEAVAFLRERAEVDYADSDDALSADELVARARGKRGIVAQLTDRFPAGEIARLEGVRVIADVAVGFDNVDLAAATRHGILVTNTPDVLTDTTADLAFALMLAAARRIVEGHRFVHSGQWKSWAIDLLAGHDVHHKTLGILGMGRIGQAVARRARGFSMRILYNDARRAPEAVERELEKAWKSNSDVLGGARLELLARSLEARGQQAAAASLREGRREMITCTRLGIPVELNASLTNTNIIESTFSQHEATAHRVKRWRNGQQLVRWAGVALLRAEQAFGTVGDAELLGRLGKALERQAANARAARATRGSRLSSKAA